MKKKIACPIKLGKDCEFLELSGIKISEFSASIKLIKEAFPHMDIPSRFWKEKLKKDETILIKENGRKLVGIANVGSKPRSASSLDLLAVHPDYQGAGIGTILLKESERYAIESGNKIMKLMTEEIKPKNIVFYSQRGYKKSGYDKHGYYHSPSVHFEKKLRK